jgi:LysR family carnitine catabolism transcriptional activator
MVRLLIQAASARQVTQAVLDGDADMGISVAGPELPTSIEFAPIRKEKFVMICSRGDVLAARKKVDWSVFMSRPFVASGPGSSIRLVTDQILAATGQAPAMQVVADNISVVGAMVAQGVGIAAVPELALRLMDKNRIQSVTLHSPTATREVGILMKKDRSLPAAALAFLDRLHKLERTGSSNMSKKPGDSSSADINQVQL